MNSKIRADLECPYYEKNMKKLHIIFDDNEEKDLHDGSHSVRDLDHNEVHNYDDIKVHFIPKRVPSQSLNSGA